MIFYSYDEFAVDAKKMAKEIKDEFDPEVILAVARGGLTLGHSLAVALENRNLFTLNSIHYEDTNKLDTIQIFNVPDLSKYTKILLVDDIIDSGESMVEIKRELLKRYPNLDIKIVLDKIAGIIPNDFPETNLIKFFIKKFTLYWL